MGDKALELQQGAGMGLGVPGAPEGVDVTSQEGAGRRSLGFILGFPCGRELITICVFWITGKGR